jgi:kinesin family member 5
MDNIKVVCRVRPLNDKEHECCVEVRDNSMVRINHRDYLAQQEQGFFAFDRTFGPDATQANIYNEIAAPLVPQIFDGVNLTILAYGQTSSGKTFTMQGYGD